MKIKRSKKITAAIFAPCRLSLFVLTASLALASVPARADDDARSSGYLQTNLVSDLRGDCAATGHESGESLGHVLQRHQSVLDQ